MGCRLLASAAVLALGAGMAQAQDVLTILHTNDVHDRFEPITKSDSTCAPEDNTAGECFGGVARLVTAIAEAKARAGEDYLLLDAGDWFQGTLFYTNYKGAAAAEFVDLLGYDVMAVGNHEFDDGPQELAKFHDALTVPLVAANADFSQEPLLAGKIAKHFVVERAGQKYGIIGLTPQENPNLASPGPNINFVDPVPAVQAEVDALTEQGIDRIVVLSHSGYAVDQRIAAETTGVDVIVGGHSHTLLSNTDEKAEGPYPTMVGDVPIVQAYAYSKYLGELKVTFDAEGKVTAAEGAPILLDASVAEDEAAVARITELAAPLEEIRNEVVAETAEAINGDRTVCRQEECTMGNLVAEAQLARVKDQGVQISLVNGGGLRASIDAGEVTMGEVLTVLPFLNTLSTFQIDGATLVEALENGTSQLEEGAGRFVQVAGMKYTFDPAAPAGSRVSDVMIAEGDGFVPVDPAATYMAVANNYVRNGGDGFAMFTDAANAYDFGPDLAEVVAAYLADHSPYQPATDGRITRK